MTHSRPVRVLIIGARGLASYKIAISQPFRYLRRQGVCRFHTKAEDEVTSADLAAADVVIFFRSYLPATYQLLETAQRMGKKTVYYTDDHFLGLPKDSELGKVFLQSPYKETYIRFLKNAQLVRVPSKYFAKLIQKEYRPHGKGIVYFTGCVDFSLFDGLKKPVRKDDKIVIGYEGGAKANAFKPVIPVLKQLLKEYGQRLQLEFYGYIPPELKGLPQVVTKAGGTSYREFMKMLYRSGWDIGIAPLSDTLIYRCKSNNKFREYAACGVPGIYSNSPAYSSSVSHRKTGYIVSHTKEGWYQGLKEMIDNPKLRQTISSQATKVARRQFTIAACAKNWRKLVLDNDSGWKG
jgi:glycosyltransferase involved in cell wall biosynthesis